MELEKDVDLVWVAREAREISLSSWLSRPRAASVLSMSQAFEAPLPASWSEHLDQERRIYFFNQVLCAVEGLHVEPFHAGSF